MPPPRTDEQPQVPPVDEIVGGRTEQGSAQPEQGNVEAVAAREPPNSASGARAAGWRGTPGLELPEDRDRGEGGGCAGPLRSGTAQSSDSARFIAFRRFFRASACLRFRFTEGFS